MTSITPQGPPRGLVLILCIVGSIGGTGTGRAQERPPLVLSLARAEELALLNHPEVGAARLDLRISRAKRARASDARFLPEFRLRNVWGPIPRARGVFTETGVLTSPDTATGLSDLRYFTEVELDFLQPIWTFGKLAGARRAAGLGVEAAKADVARSEADVRLEVRRAYWGLLLGQELLAVVEDVMEEVADAEERLQELFDEGSEEVTQNDLFKFRIFRYEIGKQHREALDRVALGKAALRAALGLAEDQDFELDTEVLEPLDVTLDSLSRYTAMALANRPELAGLRAGIEARSALVGVARSDYLPQFFLGGEIKWNRAPSRFDPKNPFVYNPTNFFRPGVVVGFNWNLNLFRVRDEVRQARYELDALAGRQEPLADGIRMEVERAYRRAKQAEINIEESSRALKASDNWLRAESQTFDLGVGEVKDVIEAFRANATMRTEHLRNIFELNVALAELSRAAGLDLYPR